MDSSEKNSLITIGIIVIVCGISAVFGVAHHVFAWALLVTMSLALVWIIWGLILMAFGGDPLDSSEKFYKYIKGKFNGSNKYK